MPHERIGQPGIPRDLGALRVVEVIPCELKIPEVDEDSNTHGKRQGASRGSLGAELPAGLIPPGWV